MRHALITFAAAAATAFTLAACDSPAEKAADNVADNIQANAEAQATDLQREAAMTPSVAEANSLVNQANQVVEDGEAKAEAVKENAEGH